MEEFNNTSIWELLKIMQEKVKNNAIIIQRNVKSAELLKQKYGRSKKREKIISSIYKQNYELTKENTSMLELHNALYKFYNNFKSLLKNKESLPQNKEVNSNQSWKEYRQLCMDKSISGELKINSNHPFIGDANFLTELMSRCANLELYERCLEIKQIKITSGFES